MGSFNSAPKIENVDSQDDDLEVPSGLNVNELLQHLKHMRGDKHPPLLNRYFLKPSLVAQVLANDITDGLRCLKLNSVSRVCSSAVSEPNQIRVLQWNILSQTLGQGNDGFVRCPAEALTWDCRKTLIVQEILQNNPDIICLQEVDHYKFLQAILSTQNYNGIFFPKPDSPCLYIEENNGPDGCAIFYKCDKFELKDFNTRVLEVWRVHSNQVAIAANLELKETGKEICVCTTHLKARQGALLSKLRNEQGRDLLRFAQQMAGDRPILLCGDFNAEPTEPVYTTVLSYDRLKLASAYSEIKKGSHESDVEELDAANNQEAIIDSDPPSDDLPDLTMIDGNITLIADDDVQNESEGVTNSKIPLLLTPSDNVYNSNGSEAVTSSASASIIPDIIRKSIANEPPYTTWKIRENGEECHTIDYVFYSKNQLKIINCLEFPHGDDIGLNRTPSFQYPSDHFSLVCDFQIIDAADKVDDVNQLPN